MTGSRPTVVPGARLLLIEDDAATRDAVAANLAGHGYRVEQAETVATALRAWDAGRPDLILLDLGLPDRDGVHVVRRVRADAATPILIISARGEESDRVSALDEGADDYLTKPFGMAELRARVGALLRRAGGAEAEPGGVLRVGPVSLDIARRETRVEDTLLELTPREYELLKVLLGRAGTVVTTGRLLRAIWGTAYSTETHYLHVYVSRLRRKLRAADPTGQAASLIEAEPGIGYRVRDP
ncbi:MAG: response regulator transcription factor [Candidatus Limnocylindrales bacterium]